MSPACPAHAALVARALGPDATDADLVRYAEEVAPCPDCRRLLGIALRVHPKVLEQGGPVPPEEAWASAVDPGMELLAAALRPPRRRWVVSVAALGVAASGLLALAVGNAPESGTSRAPAPPATRSALPAPPSSPGSAPPAQPPPRPVARPSSAAEAPAAVHVAPAPAPHAPAAAADWPLPAWEDLRISSAKSTAPPPVRTLELQLSDPAPRVGSTVGLVVYASVPTELGVCVSGPENGVVWRGAVPAGRIPLTRGGRPTGYAFAAAGTYRFVVGEGDSPSCDRPSHVVTVEVGPEAPAPTAGTVGPSR